MGDEEPTPRAPSHNEEQASVKAHGSCIKEMRNYIAAFACINDCRYVAIYSIIMSSGTLIGTVVEVVPRDLECHEEPILNTYGCLIGTRIDSPLGAKLLETRYEDIIYVYKSDRVIIALIECDIINKLIDGKQAVLCKEGISPYMLCVNELNELSGLESIIAS